MRIKELLNEEKIDRVKAKMAFTIDPDRVKVPVTNGYSNVSCFGKVSHFLKNNDPDNTWLIMFFGFVDNNEVTHVCMYDRYSQKVVDTFEGKIMKNEQGKVVYRDKNGDDHELIQAISVGEFYNQVFS